LNGYAVLEVDLMNTVAMGRNADLDTTLKAMFRARGELQRIEIADALGRHAYGAHGLQTEFEVVIGAMQYCRRIRNQYAHCAWYDRFSGKLSFVNLEELSKLNTVVRDLRSLTPREVDVTLLKEQESYFQFTHEQLVWLNYEGRTRAGQLPHNAIAKPKQPSTRPALSL
jgi:hypothetical protein